MKKFWQRNYRKILQVIVAISAVSAIISAFQIAQGNFAGFEPLLYWFGLPYGSFIWGDLLVFSLLWLAISLVLLKIENPRFFWIAFFAFWAVRSSGEAMYWFIQQFNPKSIPWPQLFPRVWILKGLSNKEFWVFNQVTHQSIAIASILGLIYQITKILKSKN